MRTGLASVRAPGRLETVGHEPLILLDGAHNPAGAEALAEALRASFRWERLHLVLAISANKDAAGIIGALAPLADRIFLARNDSVRSADPRELRSDRGPGGLGLRLGRRGDRRGSRRRRPRRRDRRDRLAVHGRGREARARRPVDCPLRRRRRAVAIEATLLIVKPDGVRRALVGEVLGRVEAKGLTIERLELRTIDRATAEEHYAEHREKPFFEELVVVHHRWSVGPGEDHRRGCDQLLAHDDGPDEPRGCAAGFHPRRLRHRHHREHRARLGFAGVGRARAPAVLRLSRRGERAPRRVRPDRRGGRAPPAAHACGGALAGGDGPPRHARRRRPGVRRRGVGLPGSARHPLPDRLHLEVVRGALRPAGGGEGHPSPRRLDQRAPALAGPLRAVRPDHAASPADPYVGAHDGRRARSLGHDRRDPRPRTAADVRARRCLLVLEPRVQAHRTRAGARVRPPRPRGC